jgi:uncharacterized damage-inducible protein DinB
MSMIKPVQGAFKFTDFIMSLALGDLKEADASKQARGQEGASIVWITGHLMAYREQAISLLQSKERANPHMDRFGNSHSGNADDYPPLSELKEQWNEQAAELAQVLEQVDDDTLNAPMPGQDGPHKEKTVLDTVNFFIWHEPYHMGSLGMIRKQLGYPSTSDLAMAAS